MRPDTRGPSRRDFLRTTGAAAGALSLGAPVVAGQLLIWSLGLPPVAPAVVIAAVAGLAVAGVSALPTEGRLAGTGLAVVLLAGYGLAASSLVLCGLLGLAVASHALRTERVASSPGQGPGEVTRRRAFGLQP